MRFLGDENIGPGVLHSLATAGHDVVAASDVCPGAPDTRLIAIAVAELRIILTEDKDFGALAFGRGLVPPGLIRLQLPGYAPAAKASRLLEVLVAGFDPTGSSIVVERNRVRSRALP